MRGRRWISAIIALTTLVLTAGCCWSRAYHPETGARLDGEYLGPRCCDAQVFVNDWTITSAGMVGNGSHTEYHTSTSQGLAPYNAQTHTWGTPPTVYTTTGTQVNNPGQHYVEQSTVLKPLVEEKMRENGFNLVDSSLLAGYCVTFDSGKYDGNTPVGWIVWDWIAIVPACFGPVPMCDGRDEDVRVNVYDSKDHLVASRIVPYKKRFYGLSLMFGMYEEDDHRYDAQTRVAANTACAMIADDKLLGGDLTAIKALIKSDPNFVCRKGSNDDTPLLWAVQKGQRDVVEWLLNNKADVNAKNKDGQTPLHVAALNKDKDLMEFLRQHGGQE